MKSKIDIMCQADAVIAISSRYDENYEIVKDRGVSGVSLLKLLEILPDTWFNDTENKILKQTIHKLSKLKKFT